MLFLLLLALSIRFFLFNFILFAGVREYLRTKGYVFNKLFSCPFCQGFWCGLGVFLATYGISLQVSYLLFLLSFGFVSAYLGLLTTVVFYPLIEKYEEIVVPVVLSEYRKTDEK